LAIARYSKPDRSIAFGLPTLAALWSRLAHSTRTRFQANMSGPPKPIKEGDRSVTLPLWKKMRSQKKVVLLVGVNR
jgi:hypothetical protein